MAIPAKNRSQDRENTTFTSERDVYEFIPDPATAIAPQEAGAGSNVNTISHGGSYRSRGRAMEINDDSILAPVAFETFRGKTYKSTAYDRGFTLNARHRKGSEQSEFQVLPSSVLASQFAKLSDFQDSIRLSDSFEHDSLAMALMGPAATHFETPLGRLKRLQLELKELEEYVSSFLVEESSKAETKDSTSENEETLKRYTTKHITGHGQKLLFGNDPLNLLKEIKVLQAEVQGMANDPKVKKLFSGVDPVIAKKSGFELVAKHLDLATQAIETAEQAICNDETEVAKQEKLNTCYELYCVPSMKPLLESSRIAALESRLNEVELKIGMKKMPLLPFIDLQSGISKIAKRISLLDPQRVEGLNKRVHSLLVELQALQSQKRSMALNTTVNDQHLQSLYDTCERWKLATAVLPVVIERLKMLKSLHREAGGINVRLNVLESQQTDLASMLEASNQNFEVLQTSVKENLNWAKRTVESFQRRLSALEEKN